jgi:cation transport ATPase
MNVSLQLAALPLWLSGLLLVGGSTLIATFGPVLVRRYVALERLTTNNEVAGFKFQTLGTIYAVLLAFVVIIVWEKFHDAETAVAQEAGAVTALYRLSRGLEPDAQARLQGELGRYLRIVIADDWPAMARGGASRDATHALSGIYDAALTSQSSNAPGETVLAEILNQLDQVTQARRARLSLASGIVPGLVWLVLFVGAIQMIVFTFFFGTANLSAQAVMTAMLTLVTSMSLLIVMALDHPYTGDVRVTAAALERVLEDFGGGPPSGPGAR